MVKPPETVVVKIGGREVSVRWTNRALFRVDASPTRVSLDDAREGRGFAFLCVHLWAMLFDEAARRRWPTPELMADAIDITDVANVRALWRVVMLHAYDVDPDAPPPPVENPQSAIADPQSSDPPSIGPSS